MRSAKGRSGAHTGARRPARTRLRRPTLIRTVAALIVACMALAACGSEAGPQVEEALSGEIVLDCEELSFPCSWAGVSEDIVRRSAELLLQAGQALDAGEDPEQVAERLGTESDVVAAVADDTGVQLRVEDAPPVVAFHPFTHPVASAIRSVTLGDAEVPAESATVERAGRSAAVIASGVMPTSTGLLAPLAAMTFQSSLDAIAAVPLFGDVSPYEPTRDPGIESRSALAIRPWADVDAETLFVQLQASGQLPPGVGSPEDLDLELAGLGATTGVLSNSDHITLSRAVDDSAFTEFAAHDLVFVQTHSSEFATDRGCNPAEGHVCGQVLGGFPIASYDGNEDLFIELLYDSAAGFPPGAAIGYIQGWWTVGYTPDFFRQAYGGGSLDSVVILNSCSSAGGSGESVFEGVASTASGSRGPAVFGWTDYINAIAADQTASVLVDLLVNDALPTWEAFSVIDGVPSLREHRTSTPTDRPRLVFSERDVRARDAIEVLDDGARMAAGAHLQVEGDPDDGQDDRLEELTLRVDGVIRDEKDDATVTWQLVGRHSEPIEIENPFESRENHEVREIEPDPPIGGAVATDRWRSYEITMKNLDLEFDVRRDELTGPIGFELRIEIKTDDGTRPSRHEVNPVFLRQGLVEVLDPELGRPLEPDERVLLEGSPDDGEAESYPLVVKIDNIDDSLARNLELTVMIGSTPVSIPGSEWERLEEGRYRVERLVELYDFEDREEPVAITAMINLPRNRTIDFKADPVVLTLASPSGCDYLSSLDMSAAMGRSFGDGEALSIFGDEDLCRWSADRSVVEIGLTGSDDVARLRQAVENGDPTSVGGFGDAATYNLEVGNALNPSGIEIDGEMQYNNFVVLFVVIDNATAATIRVEGNIVVEDGPQSGLLGKLFALVEALREAF